MKLNETTRKSLAGICFVMIASIGAFSQTNPTEWNTANSDESEIAESADQAQAFYALTKLAPNALAQGDHASAKTHAEELLIKAENYSDNWNYGNAIHVANLVLGFVALDAGEIEDAKQYLLKAGDSPGSPQMDSFGPNMLLAKELLEKGENETVFEYFAKCGRFWKLQNGKLEVWKEAVDNKQIPDFGANLIYQLGGSVRDSRNAKQN